MLRGAEIFCVAIARLAVFAGMQDIPYMRSGRMRARLRGTRYGGRGLGCGCL